MRTLEERFTDEILVAYLPNIKRERRAIVIGGGKKRGHAPLLAYR
jgi:hypothetical protein